MKTCLSSCRTDPFQHQQRHQQRRQRRHYSRLVVEPWLQGEAMPGALARRLGVVQHLQGKVDRTRLVRMWSRTEAAAGCDLTSCNCTSALGRNSNSTPLWLTRSYSSTHPTNYHIITDLITVVVLL